MTMYRLLLVLVAMVVFAGLPAAARADVEGRMPLSHIQFDSAGLDNSGPVHVEVTQEPEGVTELNVTAFGARHSLTSAQLAAVKGLIFNALGVTYARGYSRTGGRTVYILLCQAFSTGSDVAAVVTLTEKGEMRIRAIKTARSR